MIIASGCPIRFERVLAQYFDLEHFETAHPKTLGRCRVLDVVGKRVLFEPRWRSWMGVRMRAVIEQVTLLGVLFVTGVAALFAQRFSVVFDRPIREGFVVITMPATDRRTPT